MTLFDNYFTNKDKPFVENLNDALLISNVFDFTVPIELPTMFSNSTWVDTTSPRKAGVSIATLKEALPNTISITTSNSKSVLTGTGTVKLLFYPNFNTFGKFKAINWESNNNKIQVNLKKKNGTSIASNISKGNLSVNITDLEELLIEIVFTATDTLTSFTVTMENKDSNNRYGANVKVESVDGLEEELSSIENDSRWTDARNPLVIELDGSENVDELFDAGFYVLDTNISIGGTLPISTKAFILLVDGNENTKRQLLSYYKAYSGRTYVRVYSAYSSNLGWSEWKEFSFEGHTHTKANITDFEHNHDDRYYTETEVTNALNGKANSSHTHTKSEVTDFSHTHGNLSNDGKIGSASGKIITTTTNGVLQASDTITKSKISDFPTSITPTSHTHGNLSNDGKIGSASGQIVTTGTNGVLTASSTITKSKISDFPTSMTPTSHTHGNLTNAGAIGSASGKIITTSTNGVLVASDTITKSKISDFPTSMTPTSHTHGNLTNDGKLGTANAIVITDSNKNITTSATITKSKISDFPTEMTPSSHTHGNITNAGAIGSASGKIIVTGTNGVLQGTDTITKSKISDFSHTHGNLTNDGKVGSNADYFVTTTTNGAITSKQKIGNITTGGRIGSTANLPLITSTAGAISTGTFGTTSHTFAEGNHTHEDVETIILNDYATLYVKPKLRICYLRYYRQNVQFTENTLTTLHTNMIPTEYIPLGGKIGGAIIPLLNPTISAGIESGTGNFNVSSATTGTKTVNGSGLWFY